MTKLKNIYNGRRLFKPKNEHGVIIIFSRHFRGLGFDKISNVHRGYPDCTALRDGEKLKIEFEYKASNYLAHKHHHDKRDCDIVVCWYDDMEKIPRGIWKVIELKEMDIEDDKITEGFDGITTKELYEKILCLEDSMMFQMEYINNLFDIMKESEKTPSLKRKLNRIKDIGEESKERVTKDCGKDLTYIEEEILRMLEWGNKNTNQISESLDIEQREALEKLKELTSKGLIRCLGVDPTNGEK